MEQKTLKPPLCSKHGCEKYWFKTRLCRTGGWWRCHECMKAARRADYSARPERHKANMQRRRARKRAATSPLVVVTAATTTERFALTKGCAYCGVDAKLAADHVVALNDGGLHVPSNLVGACRTCNSSKRDRPVEAWFRAQPFFSEQRWQRIQTITGNGQLSLI